MEIMIKVSKGAKIRNRYNQVPPHLTQDTNGKVTKSKYDTTNESQEASPFPAGDRKAQINRRTQRHNKHKTEKNIKNPQKKYCLGTVSKMILLEGLRFAITTVLQQTSCLVIKPITVGNFAFLFNCTSVGRTSDSITVPT